MVQKILSHPITHFTITALAGLGVVICVYPHLFPVFSWGVNYAVQLMLLYMLGGLVFLFFKQPRLTFVSFAACILLCFFLKYSIKNNSLDRWRNNILEDNLPPEESVKLKAAHFNLSNGASQSEMMNAFINSNADVLSIHEVNPGWAQWLDDSLGIAYPYHHTMVDIGIFGMAIFSQYPLTSVDTFFHEDIPCLRACIRKDGADICFINVHTEPALNDYALRRLVGHLETVAAQVSRMDMPLLVMGDFNSVSWSKELQAFMNKTGLLESRAGFMDREPSFWDVPIDHIFYSPRLNCVNFKSLSEGTGSHYGITATFRLKPLLQHVKTTSQ